MIKDINPNPTKKALIFFSCLFFISQNPVNAQCISTPFATPNITGNNNSAGPRAWSNTGNVTLSDNNYTGVLALLIGENTQYHTSGGYGFSIPSTATICGIEVRVEKGEGGLLANVHDNSVRIIKNGTITGTEHALSGGWDALDNTSTYGSSTDNWGLSWTPADINNNSFGLAFSANLGGIAVLPSARIDRIQIRIWYNNILPVELTRFETVCTGESVNLQWETASESQNDYFAVQHSLDGQEFTTVKKVTGNGTTNVAHQYAFEHAQAATFPLHYYRLVQYDFNGDSVVHATTTVECENAQPSMQAYQPQRENIKVLLNGFNHDVQLSVIDLSGNVLHTYAAQVTENAQTVSIENTADLRAGCYLVTATSAGRSYSQKLVLIR